MSKRVIVDDNIIVKGEVCAAGSHMLYNFRPPFQAEAVDRLLAHGWQLTGRANVGEFAMAGTETSWFGPTKNPLSEAHLGSAAAAAVRAGDAEAGLIVDCGDSLYLSALSGCPAFRPTYGAVSRFGIIANISSSEQIGGVAPTVAEAAAAVQDAAGHDGKDATSRPEESWDFTPEASVAGKKIAYLENLLCEDTNPAVRDAAAEAAEALKAAGAQVDLVSLPYLELAGPAYTCMAAAEGCNNVSRFDGVKYGYRTEHYRNIEDLYRGSRTEGFGLHAKFVCLLGTYVLSKGNYEKYYYKALQARYLIRDAFRQLFADYDAALLPLASGVAPELGLDPAAAAARRDDDRCWSAPSLISGLPCAALPWGKGPSGLPFAVQLIADSGRDREALTAAAALEAAMKGGVR